MGLIVKVGGRATSSPRTMRGVVLALILGILGSITLLFDTSGSAFSGTTTGPASGWAAGAVSLTDTDTGLAMFTVGAPGTGQVSGAGLKPGNSVVNCIRVDYTGTVPATVRLYVPTRGTTNGTGGTPMSSYIHIKVEEGTAGAFGCSGFAGATTIWDNTLGTSQLCASIGCFYDLWGTFPTTWAAGVLSALATWAPGTTRSYRITLKLDIGTPETSKSATMSGIFTWEAQG